MFAIVTISSTLGFCPISKYVLESMSTASSLSFTTNIVTIDNSNIIPVASVPLTLTEFNPTIGINLAVSSTSLVLTENAVNVIAGVGTLGVIYIDEVTVNKVIDELIIYEDDIIDSITVREPNNSV